MISFRDRHSGYDFIIAKDNPTCDHLVKHGIFEWPLIQWCEQFLSSDKIFVDAGAHMGTYSVHLSSFCKEVHSFECQKRTFYSLCGGIALNGKDNIIPHNYALGSPDQEGSKFTLHRVSKDGGGSTLMNEAAKNMGVEDCGTEEVEVRTLDSFNLENVGFLKLDVEGSELNLLKGATETLKKSSYPPFIFEVWPDSWYKEFKNELFKYIHNELSYDIISITGVSNMFLATKSS